jgi:hypothetical protein
MPLKEMMDIFLKRISITTGALHLWIIVSGQRTGMIIGAELKKSEHDRFISVGQVVPFLFIDVDPPGFPAVMVDFAAA